MSDHKVLNLYKELDMTTSDYSDIFHLGYDWELSITGTWTGTVWVLRRFNPSHDWGVAQAYTENIEDSAVFKSNTSAYYMVAVGVVGTGTAVVRCVR